MLQSKKLCSGSAYSLKAKEKGKRKLIAVVRIYKADHLFECNLVPGWRCLVLLFPAPSTLDACPPKACLPSEGPYGETEDFALNLRPSSFWLYCRGPSCLVEGQQRGAVLPSVSLYLSPDLRIRLYHFRGVHVAIAGPISSSDDAKDTAVEDGIAIPIFCDCIRAEPLGGNRGAYARLCGPVAERLSNLSLMRARVDAAHVLSWERGSLRSANLTAICQTVLGGKEAHCCEPTVGRVSC